MIKFMRFEQSDDFEYVMLYELGDITDELLNFASMLHSDIHEHLSENMYRNDCLLHEGEMLSIESFLEMSGIQYKSTDEVFSEE